MYFFVAVKNIIEPKIDIFFFVLQKSILTLLYHKRIFTKPSWNIISFMRQEGNNQLF